MGRVRKQRRNAHGSAWHWKQTDCWYYTLSGTKQRIPLLDDHGRRIPGANIIIDGTIGWKTPGMAQIVDFRAFSGANNVIIVRPTQLGGSYGLVFP